MGSSMTPMCPMHVPGVTISAEDTSQGAAIVFTTKQGDVADLRNRVRKMAEWHNAQRADGGMMMGGGHQGHGMKGPGMMPFAATASAEDVEGGARLVMVPKNPAELAAVRSHVHEHAMRMARGDCPMAKHQGMHQHG